MSPVARPPGKIQRALQKAPIQTLKYGGNNYLRGSMLNKFRDPISGLTHLFAAVGALCGLVILLIIGFDDATKAISLAIYGLSLVLMFAASATYHLVKAPHRVIEVLRKADHSSIYLLIAGSYTPICLYFFRGFWQWWFLGIIWAMALTGVAIKIVIINAPRWLTAGIYLLMGWLSVLAVPEMAAAMPVSALIWLVLGGLFFTLGAVVYIRKKPDFYPDVFGFHELWHIFVIIGCACHFIVIAAFIAPGSGAPL
jgi:hemolysin III